MAGQPFDEANVYPPHHGMSAGTYLATRVSSLKPPMRKAPNPIRLLRMLDRHHWAFFSIAFIAWVRLSRLLAFHGSHSLFRLRTAKARP